MKRAGIESLVLDGLLCHDAQPGEILRGADFQRDGKFILEFCGRCRISQDFLPVFRYR